jgi:hypothetical protein
LALGGSGGGQEWSVDLSDWSNETVRISFNANDGIRTDAAGFPVGSWGDKL